MLKFTVVLWFMVKREENAKSHSVDPIKKNPKLMDVDPCFSMTVNKMTSDMQKHLICHCYIPQSVLILM